MCVILDLLLFLQVAGKLFPNGFKQHTGSYKLMFRRYLIKRSNQGSGLLGWVSGKESACQYRKWKRSEFSPWVGKIHRRRKWQSTPVVLPGKSHGQSPANCTPWGHKEWDTADWLSTTRAHFLSLLFLSGLHPWAPHGISRRNHTNTTLHIRRNNLASW